MKIETDLEKMRRLQKFLEEISLEAEEELELERQRAQMQQVEDETNA